MSDAFECVCEPGYEGELCEAEIDLCALGLHNCSNTTSNATYACGDPADTHDVGGFFRLPAFDGSDMVRPAWPACKAE